MNKKVLIITYYWPPAGGSGVQRWLKFSKYLRDFGWEPFILTTLNGSYIILDPSLEKDVPKDIKVYRAKTRELLQVFFRFSKKRGSALSVGMIGVNEPNSLYQKIIKFIRANFFIPDARKGWNKYAFPKAVEIIKSESIETVITTGPPHSTHFMGLKLKKKLGIKWIADFRDPWINIYYSRLLPKTNIVKKIDLHLEKKIVTQADHVIVVSEGLKADLSRHNGQFTVIYNGYDESDIVVNTEGKTNSKFTLAHIGNFLPDYDCPDLWLAIKELENQLPGFKESFQIKFTGPVDPSAIASLKQFELFNYASFQKYVPHKEANIEMGQADLLLFILPKNIDNKLIISGKIFEYMASQTPILSMGPIDGEASLILDRAGRDKMMTYDDKGQIKALILRYYNHWNENNKISFKHTESSYKEFSRRELSRQLSEVLNKIAALPV